MDAHVIVFGGYTHTGQAHAENEDTIWTPQQVTPELLARKGYLFIVADGVGGHQGGKLASQVAVEALQRSYYTDAASPDIETALRRAVEAANAAVRQQASDTDYTDMSSTVVAAVIYQDLLVVANVGDSRAYLWRKGKKMRQLSTDHTWVAERLAEGTINAEEAAHHQLRHVITRSLGQHLTVEPAMCTVKLLPGDRLLLCCDGIWEPLMEETLNRGLGYNLPPQRIAHTLANDALKAGASDDVSAVVAVTGEPATVVDNPVQALVQMITAWQAASPLAFLLGALAGSILLLALLGQLFSSAVRGLRALPVPPPGTPPPTLTTSIPATHTRTPMPTQLPTTEVPIVDIEMTPTPEPMPTSTPVPPSPTPGPYRYCILPSTNPSAPNAPAGNINPQTCLSTGASIPVGADIEVLPNTVSAVAQCEQPVIRVLYQQADYLIFTYRIGLRDTNSQCTLLDWQTHFRQPRQE